jgi:hypothetical protein
MFGLFLHIIFCKMPKLILSALCFYRGLPQLVSAAGGGLSAVGFSIVYFLGRFESGLVLLG